MALPNDVEKSGSLKMPEQFNHVENLKAVFVETEFASSAKKRSKWGRLIDASSRQFSSAEVGRKRAWYARGVFVLALFSLVGAIAFLIYISLVMALLHRLSPVMPHNGVEQILSEWKEPASASAMQTSWLPNFSTGIAPKPIHSHNDYSRDIPLFRALSVGCTSVEADIWLIDDDLQVGHTRRALRPARTLQSLYLNPIMNILNSQNKQNPNVNISEPFIGVFNHSPRESLILLLDFKRNADMLFPLVMAQLAPFREAGYLTRYDGSKIVQAPLTIVASGEASTRLDLMSTSNGTIFADAPLIDLAQPDSPYNFTNSFYASAPIEGALHSKIPVGGMTRPQKSIVQDLVKQAQMKGLRARFWATPSWPVSLRHRVWKQLERSQVGMLNVDDVRVAAMWNWEWCVVAGVRLC
ncbi:hypothetical protein FKW77_003571 [Venturia effusa]|uniref:Altered inheritance of mitochondria protein 6 n=1 Tax=Venturia effusa TaxID=50376 RepID=A0A517LLD5_9PEZI|nr:hypothetical protein FKW77_003571 [Venturia effusa]